MSTKLLKGGTVILHGENDALSFTKADILVERNTISRIEWSITVPPGCEIIDCRDKIISTGFVDTHHHMWESALKGLCEDLTCVSYFAQMFTASFTFTPDDVYWGNLAGCLEAIDAGTTTVLDFAHMNWTKDHGKQALAGTITSGIRSVFAFAPTVTLKQAYPKPEITDLLPDWFMPTLEQLVQSKHIKTDDARVSMGFAFDYYFMPQDVVIDIFSKVRSLGIDIVTSHWARFPGQVDNNLPRLLKSYGLLDERIVLSHVGGATVEDVQLLNEAKAFASASPSVEMTMGLGPPVCFRHDLPNMDSVCSLGVDCHHSTSGSMVNEMRVGLLSARGAHAVQSLADGVVPDKVCRTAHDAYIMGTIQGARALCMEDQIGSIKVGKKADLVIFGTDSPAMTGAAHYDPVKAIVMHSSIADVDMVIVDGVIRKRNGKLLPAPGVIWSDSNEEFIETGTTISWKEISAAVLETQQRFVSKLPEFDMEQLKAFVRGLYNIP
ncbi:hypothetical protein QQS21_003583 [Conoideocrella luteorostrata]|uniref:Amidohydrolase-related domain-containing protein n=1 Tax=Conoideocrella luteorostrata TaxID=1105319 RepID=A0AAJ0G0G8_9HYPO|nr:hypothetical protein QQS21_003583 [Conoideocrella luteorostrata]